MRKHFETSNQLDKHSYYETATRNDRCITKRETRERGGGGGENRKRETSKRKTRCSDRKTKREREKERDTQKSHLFGKYIASVGTKKVYSEKERERKRKKEKERKKERQIQGYNRGERDKAYTNRCYTSKCLLEPLESIGE